MHSTTLPTDAWLPSEAETSAVADVFGRRTATLVPDLARQMPDLASRIETPAALLLPLAHGAERIGLLVIGFTRPPAAQVARGGSDIADAFLAALTLFRLKHREALQNDVRELLDEFAAGLSRSMNIALRLEAFCQGRQPPVRRGPDLGLDSRVARARHLILQASSASGYVDAGQRIGADDPRAPAASAMRQRRAELVPGSYDLGTSTATLTVPLRGYRRALGAIVFDGVRVDVGGELDLLDRADELGRQVSNAVENLQLLDEVIRSRHVLENAFDSIAHLVAVCDLRGQIVHANEAFANRAGVSREELFDRSLGTTVGPELGGWLSDLDRVHRPAGAPPAVCEVVDSVLGGPLLVTATDVLDQNRDCVGQVLVARDLTPQTALEAEREELRNRLTQSEKLAALGQFVAGIAHELNNPLQSVLGHLELLRATGAFPRQLRQEVQIIYREADRAAKIVRNLLVFTGARRLVRRPVNLNALLQRVAASRHAACRAQNIEIVRNYDEKQLRLKSDPLSLHQVFLNMVVNAEQAIAASGRPGRIEISTRATGRDPHRGDGPGFG